MPIETSSRFTRIGRISRAVGLKGEVKVAIEQDWEGLETIEAFFIFRHGIAERLPVQQMTMGKHVTARFVGITDRNAADLLKGHDLFVKSRAARGLKLPWEELIGLTAVDVKTGTIGVIEDVLAYPGQHLAKVTHEGREVLIPLHVGWIVDTTSERVVFDLPEGLLDIV